VWGTINYAERPVIGKHLFRDHRSDMPILNVILWIIKARVRGALESQLDRLIFQPFIPSTTPPPTQQKETSP